MNSKLNMSGWKVSRLTPCRVDTPEGSISVSWNSKAEEAARLIAAAPDLLQALIAANAELEMWRAGFPNHSDSEEVAVMIDEAIAKATGESA
jgi:predicted metallopeptidase